ncbi:cell wall-active antibiotics response protein LiaF [Paenibacillus sp. UMB4589-SE434]|uniref:cell wall-active antibiotics response protein LiaF n=1 Tax=Paenibacillus sp. UMB4589-SE434 TaxID=3046314 RepID=UPI00254B9489|nr:cell wall-active antibiotics response protein LiaF [Paenibacillus sp. UMB4589-SE434]MDK8183112.1 cell wall-active antibiotics response protein LiaF [Paenibacillus sp. UMB4589-SE434]
MNEYNRGRWLGGFVLICIGLVFLLHQWGYVSFDIGDLIRTYWPLIVIFVGLSGLLQGGFWGVFPLGVGVYFLLRNLGIVTLSMGDFIKLAFPFALIVGGIFILFRPRHTRHRNNRQEWRANREEWRGKRKEWKAQKQQWKSGCNNGKEDVSDYPDYTNYPDPFKDVNYSADNKQSNESETNGNIGAGTRPHNYNYESEPHKQFTTNNEDKGRMYSEPMFGKHRTVVNKSGFIGDIHMGQDFWELKPMNVSHFIGDTTLDLTKAQVPYGETKINISSFVGDVKVYIPNDVDLGVVVTSTSFIGDVRVLDMEEGGFLRNVQAETPQFYEAGKKVRIIVNTFIGDVKVMKVG